MTRVAGVGAAAIADMRVAADRRLHRRFVALSVVIVVLLVALAGATYLAWPRIQALSWVQDLEHQINGDTTAPPSPPQPVATSPVSASVVPATGDALSITGWATWGSSNGGAAFGAQIMLRRASTVGDGQPGVYFLYPAASAPGFATVPVTYQGKPYRAVATAPATWTWTPSNLATHIDITCSDTPVTCSGARSVYDPKVTVDQVVPALIANVVSDADDQPLRVLSAAPVTPGDRKNECDLIPCG